MTRLALLFTALGALVACAAPSAAARPPIKSMETGCAIREIQRRGGVELVPVVWSRRSIEGNYSFTIDKIGRSGSSSVAQGGPVDVHPGHAEQLGSVAIGQRPMGYRARLVVTDGVQPVCIAKAPDRGA
jgi:hypothetical protein